MTLYLAGELDIESAATLASELRELAHEPVTRVVLDLAGVEFIDSAGISVLVHSRLQAGQANRQLILTNLPRNVGRVFEISGISSQFAIA